MCVCVCVCVWPSKALPFVHLTGYSEAITSHGGAITSYSWDITGYTPALTAYGPTVTKQVSIVAMDDKREMTVLLSCTLSGELLPPQFIYAGHTPRYHPPVSFPDKWNVIYSVNHWSAYMLSVLHLHDVLNLMKKR